MSVGVIQARKHVCEACRTKCSNPAIEDLCFACPIGKWRKWGRCNDTSPKIQTYPKYESVTPVVLQAFFDTPLEQYTNEKLLALKKDYENDIANLGAGCSACAKSGIKAKYTHKIHQCLTSSHF